MYTAQLYSDAYRDMHRIGEPEPDDAFAIFSVSHHGHMEVAYQDAVGDMTPEAYALRSIPHLLPADEAWRMWAEVARCALL